MPTYEYRCTSCGEHLEVVQRFSEDPLTVCPACGGALRKVFAPVGILFKGSGFYKTDSRTSTGARSSERAGTDTPKLGAEPAAAKEAPPSGPTAGEKSPATGDATSGAKTGGKGDKGSSKVA